MKKGRDWLIIIFGGVIAVRLAGNLWSLYKSGEMVKQSDRELEAAQKESEELKKKWEYVQSPEFVEKEAREKLGLGKLGEVVVILPSPISPNSQASNPNEPNWKKWWKLYVGS